MINQQIYKANKTNNNNMIPSDPTGSLDDSIFNHKFLKSLIYRDILWKK